MEKPKKKKKTAADAFLKAYGDGVQYRKYTEADAKRLASRIPEPMREILERQGFCSYKDQAFWFCDPADWEAAGKAWFSDAEHPEVLARTAFGDLFVWDHEMFWIALVHTSEEIPLIGDAGWFFSQTLTSRDFPFVSELPGRVRDAEKSAGTIEWDEIYGYVPALALGGNKKRSRVEVAKALEALVMLSELAPIRRP